MYSSSRKVIHFIICVAVVFNIAVATSARHVHKQQTFELRVQFGLPGKARTEIRTEVNPNVPFSGEVTDKEGHRYKIGGMLLPHTRGKYRVVITALRWDELSGDTFGTFARDLDVNKTVTVCNSDGLIHGCVGATLT